MFVPFENNQNYNNNNFDLYGTATINEDYYEQPEYDYDYDDDQYFGYEDQQEHSYDYNYLQQEILNVNKEVSNITNKKMNLNNQNRNKTQLLTKELFPTKGFFTTKELVNWDEILNSPQMERKTPTKKKIKKKKTKPQTNSPNKSLFKYSPRTTLRDLHNLPMSKVNQKKYEKSKIKNDRPISKKNLNSPGRVARTLFVPELYWDSGKNFDFGTDFFSSVKLHLKLSDWAKMPISKLLNSNKEKEKPNQSKNKKKEQDDDDDDDNDNENDKENKKEKQMEKPRPTNPNKDLLESFKSMTINPKSKPSRKLISNDEKTINNKQNNNKTINIQTTTTTTTKQLNTKEHKKLSHTIDQFKTPTKKKRNKKLIKLPPNTSNEESENLKQQVNPSPISKKKYQTFQQELKKISKNGLKPVVEFVKNNLHLLPNKIHWKVFLDLADFSKREHKIHKARNFFRFALELQPYDSRIWLEFAKMEEEQGDFINMLKVLVSGIKYCSSNETLVVKALQQLESFGLYTEARELIENLNIQSQNLDKTWKICCEVALFEARIGNIEKAREIFENLFQKVPWATPAFNFASLMELRFGFFENAQKIALMGLEQNPRYGPLWFLLLKIQQILYEKGLVEPKEARELAKRANDNLTQELKWKVNLELAKFEYLSNNLKQCRICLTNAALSTPKNLRWKIWLAGARIELKEKNILTAKSLLNKALEEVNYKSRSMVLIEMAKIEEFNQNYGNARYILQKAKKGSPKEWKVCLESILLEIRAGCPKKATRITKESIELHPGTGRIWAIYIHLLSKNGIDDQLKIFRKAIQEVPKSGEVWCEGARILLNPKSKYFNLKLARRFLNFAIQFTPQYGESFIELIRLELLENGLQTSLKYIKKKCLRSQPNFGQVWNFCKNSPYKSVKEIFQVAKKNIKNEIKQSWRCYQHAIIRYLNLNKQKNNITNSRKNNNNNNNGELNENIDIQNWDDIFSIDDFITGLQIYNRQIRNMKLLSPKQRIKMIFGQDNIV
ncbi:tpr-containing protein [Anaeramoeba flamelloides]|uniref:Tpr-containing protein n=1 Tax=Anaeramoeba flamelloides TaxID=1746091 RepID=A0ABQ8YVY9_9EUKA|nr:tpr-containing protein [Anaeramoeba flamelloides]